MEMNLNHRSHRNDQNEGDAKYMTEGVDDRRLARLGGVGAKAGHT